MQVLQIPKNIRPWLESLPPMYNWPVPLKRVVLALTVTLCMGAYLLLIGGLLAIIGLLMELALSR